MRSNSLFWLLTLTALLGCSQQTDLPHTAAPQGLSPYQTRTPLIVSTVTPPVFASPTTSPTPFIYSIARGDTLSGLALRFGLSVETLLSANPGLVPESLSPGQKVNIPAQGQVFVASPLSTPAPVDIDPVICHTSAGGVTCLAPVHNPYPEVMENVKIELTLLDSAGQTVSSRDAILPLDILAPGQTLPAGAFFEGLDGQYTAQARLLTAVRLSAGDTRYLRADIQNLLVKIAWDGLSANLQGRLSLPQGSSQASRLWLAAVAYDSTGQITGYRRWEAPAALKPGENLPFALNVYSLGALIERVAVQIEAAKAEPGQK